MSGDAVNEYAPVIPCCSPETPRPTGMSDRRRFPPLRGRSIEDRFWEKVDKRGPDECWPWIAGHHSFGYGVFGPKTAHRVSYELEYGPIDSPKLVVCHRCDNPPCVNPAHLFLGSQRVNMQDAKSKGRTRTCAIEDNPMTKLTWEQVREARRRRALGEGVNALARAYNIDNGNMSRVLRGLTWVEANR